MQVLALLLSLWLAIQNYSKGCTLSLCPPCHYGCVVKCNHIDCLGADCSGFRKCHEKCPPGTFAMPTKPSNPCERCSDEPCKNNGVCTELNDPSRDEKVKCDCPKPFKGKRCERWGKSGEHFKLSYIGLSCQNPVNETKVCQEAASLAKIQFLTEENIIGDGTDLPYGCISDKVSSGSHYMYWNPKGRAISADPNIRQICHEQDPSPSSEGLDCVDDYRKIAGPDSCQVKPHSKPWMANLVRKSYNFKHFCGGVLIGTRLVLTASHCICQRLGERFAKGPECTRWKDTIVILGDHDSETHSMRTTKGPLESRKSVEQQEIEIEYAETVPKWKGYLEKGNDIAILVLKTPASLTENVKIAYLPSPDASCQKFGNKLVVSGWGRSIIWIYDQNGVSKFQFFRDNRFLWAVKQQCLDITQCDNYEGDQKDALCVGDLSESRNSAYKGDSGGPLTFTEDGITTVYGLVSARGMIGNSPEMWDRHRTLYGRVADVDTLKWIKTFIRKYEK